MPAHDDFNDLDHPLDRIRDTMPGSDIRAEDDGEEVIPHSNLMEVVCNRIDPDDPDCGDFRIHSVEADDTQLIEAFAQAFNINDPD